MTDTLYHIATLQDWSARQGRYWPSGHAGEGFIHCCTAEQLTGVAGRYFRGRSDLVVLTIDPRRLDAEVRWENLLGGDERFPHLYGTLDPDAVREWKHLSVAESGALLWADD